MRRMGSKMASGRGELMPTVQTAFLHIFATDREANFKTCRCGEGEGFQSSEMEIFLSRLRQEARFLTRTLARKSVYLQHYMPTPQMWSGLSGYFPSACS
jgi:hypothetical protein